MMHSGKKGVPMEWGLMFDQSRLRKEKRLAEKQSTSESQVEKKIETHVRKLIDTS